MYEVEFTKKAYRQFKKFPAKIQDQLQETIEGLEEDPRPQGYTKLSGKLNDFYRVRSGNYRIIYSIEDKELTVYLLKIADRKKIYKKNKHS
ncbi:type II toxin-antitoxin system RelE/ParE family toxin [Maridesulfovibrio ferrireducens]|uniref:type II toxin-antitoxin system RelE family toxin n=1 Tax=Maridesulfovibrio ferrireducens TaxID=246191 RepID=UPI001A2F1B63|nr:type II toxin-antitoxin system RelE/ParE family toxin [Maridesulfovibrio ferrireducens]MBI9110258.1 type II toxin-antitoxin system RelE/ParE family toxin [Maridesulfovibrio ferrireducens]